MLKNNEHLERQQLKANVSAQLKAGANRVRGYFNDILAGQVHGTIKPDTSKNTSEKNKVPPEALITLGDYQIISQEWLSKQPPLDGFFEVGQEINPSIKETDGTKRQCWLDNGIYRYNQLGSDWVLRQLGARVPSIDEIITIHAAAQGTTNAEKMKSIGVVTTGWRDPGNGRFWYADFAFLRSCSQYGVVAGWFPVGSGIAQFFLHSSTGIVPFGVMDKTVSA